MDPSFRYAALAESGKAITKVVPTPTCAGSVGKSCFLSPKKWLECATDFFRRHSHSIIGNAELIFASGILTLNVEFEAHIGTAVLHGVFANIPKDLRQKAFRTPHDALLKTHFKDAIHFFHSREELLLKRPDKRLRICSRLWNFGIHAGKSKQVGYQCLHSGHATAKHGICILMFRGFLTESDCSEADRG